MSYVQIIFSPTGGTEKAAHAITRNWSDDVKTIDLCDPSMDFSQCAISPEDVVLIALPSYGGRVPELVAARLRQVRGNGARCILTCVYGNRAYEDTLVEMEDIAKECGFTVFAAISAVAEHSIIHQYAAGRPDAQDEQLLKEFAGKIKAALDDPAHAVHLALPGNRPYKKQGGGQLVPKANNDCVKCGLCAKRCPTQAISKDHLETADADKCISCMRCVVKCPKGARKVNSVIVSAAALAIKKACSVRKECDLFL